MFFFFTNFLNVLEYNCNGDCMGKEKISKVESEKKEFIFLYELLGIIFILVSLISIARLGIIGKYGMLIFRLLFGDWYFIFIIAFGALGVYFLFVHHHMEIKNIRYLGILLILIALVTLTHFSMHNYVKKLAGNELKNTLLLYFDYFKNGRNEQMTGGGIIGCLFFYLSYFLLSSVGTIIINIILIFIGIVFISKKTIVDFLKTIGEWFKKTFGGAVKIKVKVKNIFEKFNKDYTVRTTENKILKINYLNDSIPVSKNSKTCMEYSLGIKKVLDHLNIFYQEVTYLDCNHISVYFIKTRQKVNFEVFRITLKKIINEQFLIRFNKDDNLIIVEVNKEKLRNVMMKEVVEKNLPGIVLGIDDRNKIVNTWENVIIISENNNIYRYYFATLVLYPHFLVTTRNEEYNLIDLNENLKMLEGFVNNYTTQLEYFKNMKDLFDQTVQKINDGNASNIEEYNKKHKEKIKKQFFYINGIEKIYQYNDLIKIFEYLLITSKAIGFQIIVGLTCNQNLTNEKIRLFNYKIFLKNDFDYSEKILGYGMIDVINPSYEGFLKYQDLLLRINLLMILPEEIDRLKKNRSK